MKQTIDELIDGLNKKGIKARKAEGRNSCGFPSGEFDVAVMFPDGAESYYSEAEAYGLRGGYVYAIQLMDKEKKEQP